MGSPTLKIKMNSQANKNTEITENIFLNAKDKLIFDDNRLLNSALNYAKSGFRVFPLHNLKSENGTIRCSCRGWEECNHIGKHPRTRNGLNDATTSESRIREWWRLYPDANIGLPTGYASGIFVLDIDVKHNGEESLEDLQYYYRSRFKNKFEPLPGTLIAHTGSGGRHLYFKNPPKLRSLKNSASKIEYGLDIRANGGYVVAPPSSHYSGKNYQWFGVNTPIEDAPNWLIYEILKADEVENNSVADNKPPTFSISSKLAAGEKLGEGSRNDYLFRQVCGLVNSFPKEETLRRAFEMNLKCFETALSDKEVENLVNGVYRRYG